MDKLINWEEIPKYLNYAAMDESGCWMLYSYEPEIVETINGYWKQNTNWYKEGLSAPTTCRIPKDFAPDFKGNWKDSLIGRFD